MVDKYADIEKNDFNELSVYNIESEIKLAIDNALSAAASEGVSGKEATPYLLGAIAKITEGRSLQTSTSYIVFFI